MIVSQFILGIQFLFGSIAVLKKFIGNLKLFRQGVSFFKIFDPFFFRAKVSNEDFCFTGVVPKVGSKGFFFFVGYFDKLGINVKDTSSTHRGALQYL